MTIRPKRPDPSLLVWEPAIPTLVTDPELSFLRREAPPPPPPLLDYSN